MLHFAQRRASLAQAEEVTADVFLVLWRRIDEAPTMSVATLNGTRLRARDGLGRLRDSPASHGGALDDSSRGSGRRRSPSSNSSSKTPAVPPAPTPSPLRSASRCGMPRSSRRRRPRGDTAGLLAVRYISGGVGRDLGGHPTTASTQPSSSAMRCAAPVYGSVYPNVHSSVNLAAKKGVRHGHTTSVASRSRPVGELLPPRAAGRKVHAADDGGGPVQGVRSGR